MGENHIGNAGADLLASAIKEARCPLTIYLYNNNIGDTGAKSLTDAVKLAKIPLTLGLKLNPIEDDYTMSIADAIKQDKVSFNEDCNDGLSNDIVESLNYAIKDNFVIDARSNPSRFLTRIKFNLDKVLNYPAVIAVIIQEYISKSDLAWTGVAAIRAVEDASHENKYSSINYELLAATYFYQRPLERILGQEEGNHSSSLEAAWANEAGGDRKEDSIVSSSSHDSSPGGGGDTINSSELTYNDATVAHYLSDKLHRINYAHKQDARFDNDDGVVSASESLLKLLFTWIKDLPDEQQRKLLSSFSMQQVLELLEDINNPHRFIADQLSSKPLEEIFIAEHKNHYGHDISESNETDYATNQKDSIHIPIDFGNALLSDSTLITIDSYNYGL